MFFFLLLVASFVSLSFGIQDNEPSLWENNNIEPRWEDNSTKDNAAEEVHVLPEIQINKEIQKQDNRLEHQQTKKKSVYTCKCVTIYPNKNKSKTGRSNLRKVNSNQRSPRRIQSNPYATLQTPTATWTDMDEAGFLEIERKDGQEKVSEKIDEDTTPPSITSNRTDYFDWFGILGLFHKIVLSQADLFSNNLNGTELGSGSSNISSSSQINSIGELHNST
ncbi:uncharacterized protein LOC111712462 isoform X2 [Eurytemora carolleeae]|uniref:uncharacterized protein LOC111712462 isoform X2 n=1 Tax=Eurytemora carolleeae TaxID=1294199 RepID=UPI000C765EEF|nr:uncharacterized protein LOC111712462 isoform X2 [Eurytemora carolleeae]|eukprot:XP_023342843.1 uncharacterized protein LOC111712462 isoform X2 [Eurytemora affinis]